MYRGLQPLDDDLQTRHDQQQRMLAATMTMHEAVARYGISSKVLYRRLTEADCWPAIKGRWWIADIEAVLGRDLDPPHLITVSNPSVPPASRHPR